MLRNWRGNKFLITKQEFWKKKKKIGVILELQAPKYEAA